MLKSCQYCGKIHDSKFDCGRKPQRIKRRGKKEQFRSSGEWQRKAEEIKQRDKYLCQLCLRNFKGTRQQLNSRELSVHHIEPLEEAFEKRVEEDNLLTVCGIHHEMAESGEIDRKTLHEIAKHMREISPRLEEG